MLPLVAVLLAGAGAAPLRAASPAPRAAARRDVAAFLDGQPAGASVEALVAAFAARRAAREPDRAAGVHALKRALLKRRLFDVHAMADAADASVLDGSCACPLTADECAETTVYNNTLLHRPSDGSPMELYYRETQPLDAMLAGDAHCQELQGFEVCDDSPDCVPSTASLIYDCDAAAATMLGVAQVTGDDDMFYGLTSQTVYVYTLLELQGQVTCSDGCNFYDACKTSCGGLAAEGADQSLDLDTSCTGVLEYVTPAPTAPPSTAAPSTAAPSPLPAPAPTLAPLPAPTAPPRQRRGAASASAGGDGAHDVDAQRGPDDGDTDDGDGGADDGGADDGDGRAHGGVPDAAADKRRDEAAAEAEAPPPELEAPPPPVAVDDVEADAGALVVASEPPADALVPATDAPAASTAIKTKINEAEL
ncbi:hypothetical protein JL721_3496 [Aureococcus anophagefferens]|nr:hypothetical protein JL721_3496 [Aureococcus anophagefferens]